MGEYPFLVSEEVPYRKWARNKKMPTCSRIFSTRLTESGETLSISVLCSLSRLLSSCCKQKQFFATIIQLEQTAIWYRTFRFPSFFTPHIYIPVFLILNLPVFRILNLIILESRIRIHVRFKVGSGSSSKSSVLGCKKKRNIGMVRVRIDPDLL